MAADSVQTAIDSMLAQAEQIRLGGGSKGIERQHRHGRLTARERIDRLVDPKAPRFECGLFAAHGMYSEYGGAASAGVVTEIGQIGGRPTMIVISIFWSKK